MNRLIAAPNARVKIDRPSIFNYMQARTYQIVIYGKEVGTALAIGENQILACMHTTVYEIPAKGKRFEGACVTNNRFEETSPKQIRIIEKIQFRSGAEDLEGTLLHFNPALDACIYKVDVPIPHFRISETPIRGGETVYFGGFPLTQRTFTFHKGMVSSVDPNQFTVDGTVVKGNSGGPIVKIENGEIRLVGMLVSEIAEIDQAFRNLLPKLMDMQQTYTGPVASNDFTGLAIKGTGFHRDLLTLQQAILKNISTGIGHGIIVSDDFVPRIERQEPMEPISAQAHELVGKGDFREYKRAIREHSKPIAAPIGSRNPKPPTGTFSPCVGFTDGIVSTYVPIKMAKYMGYSISGIINDTGFDTTQTVLVSSGYSNSEGSVFAAIQKIGWPDSTLRVDLQKETQFHIPGYHGDLQSYSRWQVQFGTSQASGGGAFGGVLARTDTPFQIAEYQIAIGKSIELQEYVILRIHDGKVVYQKSSDYSVIGFGRTV